MSRSCTSYRPRSPHGVLWDIYFLWDSKFHYHVAIDYLTAVKMSMLVLVFWVVALRGLLGRYQRDSDRED
jgi:hypothetical protein